MLEIVDVIPNVQGVLEIDEYVLFMFSIEPTPLVDPMYWRIRDFNKDLVDLLTIKIDKTSGEIFGVTLIIHSKGIIDIANDIFDIPNVIDGLPVAKMDAIHKRVHDENGQLRLYRSDNQFIVGINDIVPPSKCIRGGRLRFYLSQEKLVSIGLDDLTTDEIKLIESLMN